MNVYFNNEISHKTINNTFEKNIPHMNAKFNFKKMMVDIYNPILFEIQLRMQLFIYLILTNQSI